MEINRRNFILSIVGGLVGIQVTPLPWKLMDDSAIWTQNWPWVPVPPRGKFISEKTVCTLCPGGCGIEVRKVDNRAVKIEGRTDFPVNPGGVCPVGMGGLQLLYDESIRFTEPMKRVGPRGAGQFKNISWDEALDLLAKRIHGLRKAGRPEALAVVDGNRNGTTMASLVKRFTEAVGSPNYTRIPSMEDTYRMANFLLTGYDGHLSLDLENSTYILSFGCGLLEGWGAPGRVLNAWSLWKEKAQKVRTVQIEPRSSNTASKADEWLAPYPGTEGALALGIAHVIVKNGLFNTSFVKAHTYGFEDWKSEDGKTHMGFKTFVLKNYSPEKVAEITGLTEEKIVRVAKAFAGAKAPIAICGKGKGLNNGSLYEFMAVQSLNALVGNINRPGGVFIDQKLPLSPLPDLNLDPIAQRGLEKSPLGYNGASKIFPFLVSSIKDLTEAIARADEGTVDTLLIFAANPVYTLPDGGAFKKALKKVPFIVSFSPFQDETSYMADLVLPDNVYLEKRDEVVCPEGLQYPLYALSKPVVKPLYNTRHTGDVLIHLAKRLGMKKQFPWSNFDDVLKYRVRGLFEAGGGLTSYDGDKPVWEQLKQKRRVKPDYSSFDQMWRRLQANGLWYTLPKNVDIPSFRTASGKFEFFSSKLAHFLESIHQEDLKELGINSRVNSAPYPHYESVSTPVDRNKFPLTLIPYELINLADGAIPSPPFLTKTIFDNQLRKNDSFLDINPKTAVNYNLKEGEKVFVQSPRGVLEARVCLTEEVMPGYVFMPLGFGHTAYDEFLKSKGANPNEIIDPGKDPLSRQYVWWNTPVRLIRT